MTLPSGHPRAIRVLALMESRWITGPAKNLLAFAAQLREPAPAGFPKVDLSVVCFDRPSASAGRFIDALREAGIRTHVIRESRAGDPRVIPQLLAILRAERPDVIQTHNTKSHFLVWLTRTSRRFPWIAFFHGFTATDSKDQAYNRLARWVFRRTPRIVTVCEAFSRDLQGLGVSPTRITVRHNMVAPFVAPSREELEALRAGLSIPEGARVFLAVGRLSSEKGHADLLDAFARVRQARPSEEMRLAIVGDGPERKALEQRAAELGIGGYVVFTGHQPSARPYYGMADVFVLPSHSEGSPNVLLEAMAAGLPIVSTAAGGAAELVSHENTALVIPCGDPAAMSRAMLRLLEDPELVRRLGTEARNASRSFTPESYAASIVRLYQAAIADPRPRAGR